LKEKSSIWCTGSGGATDAPSAAAGLPLHHIAV
jgi:hypothetical protein